MKGKTCGFNAGKYFCNMEVTKEADKSPAEEIWRKTSSRQPVQGNQQMSSQKQNSLRWKATAEPTPEEELKKSC